MAVREKHQDKASQFVDIQFEEVIADPVASLRRAYGELGMAWSGEVELRMRTFLADNPRHKHGGHRYELSDFGLELGAIRERFEAYCERYAIPLVM
jgi:hypothetical protein